MQNLPVLVAPHVQVQIMAAGLGEPHWGQNFPVFTAPQLQVHLFGASGRGLPHSMQN